MGRDSQCGCAAVELFGDSNVTLFHIHVHHDSDETQKLLTQLIKEIHQMALDLTALTQAVNDEKTVEQSAITLLNGLTKQIADLVAASGNTVDPAALQAIVDQVNADKQALADAVAANTPAAPPPAP